MRRRNTISNLWRARSSDVCGLLVSVTKGLESGVARLRVDPSADMTRRSRGNEDGKRKEEVCIEPFFAMKADLMMMLRTTAALLLFSFLIIRIWKDGTMVLW